jgi:hypothetical protein
MTAHQGCIGERCGDNAAMARRPVLVLAAALVPAVTIAVALLGVTAVREHARSREAARSDERERQGYLESQQLATQLHDARLEDREHQRLAQERERALQESILALQRQLAQSEVAQRTTQESLVQAQARIQELSHPVIPPGAAPAASATPGAH